MRWDEEVKELIRRLAEEMREGIRGMGEEIKEMTRWSKRNGSK